MVVWGFCPSQVLVVRAVVNVRVVDTWAVVRAVSSVVEWNYSVPRLPGVRWGVRRAVRPVVVGRVDLWVRVHLVISIVVVVVVDVAAKRAVVYLDGGDRRLLRPSRLVGGVFSLRFFRRAVVKDDAVVEVSGGDVSFVVVSDLFVDFVGLFSCLRRAANPALPHLTFSCLGHGVTGLVTNVRAVRLSSNCLITLVPCQNVPVLCGFAVAVVFRFRGLFFLSHWVNSLDRVYIDFFFFAAVDGGRRGWREGVFCGRLCFRGSDVVSVRVGWGVLRLDAV